MNRFFKSMKLIRAYLSVIIGSSLTCLAALALFTWEFIGALWGVVVLGKNAEDLL
jgi:hypothetical protein